MPPLDQIRSRMFQPNNVVMEEGEDISELRDILDLEGGMTAPGEVVGGSKRPLEAGPTDSAPYKRRRPDGQTDRVQCTQGPNHIRSSPLDVSEPVPKPASQPAP